MIRSPTEIRSATREEMSQTVATIVAAFITDPVARFAWPAAHDYLRAMPAATRAFAGGSFAHATAYVSADFCGAALWLPPGMQPNGEALETVFRETARTEHQDDLLATFEKMEHSHPDEPHWYLPLIGVEPNAQGKASERSSCSTPWPAATARGRSPTSSRRTRATSLSTCASDSRCWGRSGWVRPPWSRRCCAARTRLRPCEWSAVKRVREEGDRAEDARGRPFRQFFVRETPTLTSVEGDGLVAQVGLHRDGPLDEGHY